ncbi:MAG: acyl-CoA thioesterase II, partial [Saprospiraceae bacterium]|nr:acyl-CoA thioesterase II [Saprospiraceae bacterium]
DLLTLEEIDKCLFRGRSYVTSWRRVFGGQVLGQALNAAYRTVPEDRLAHSLHGYFILPGNVDRDIIYQVDVLRDGGSFTTRRVTASQEGRAIFIMAASFQLKQEGIDHQNEMPQTKQPENLMTDVQQVEVLKQFAPELAKKLKGRSQNAIEFRPVENLGFDESIPGKTPRNVWMKVNEAGNYPIPLQHQMLAYASDYDLLLSAVYPHRNEIDINNIFVASLDHAMWFHRDFNFSDWLLYNIDSPSASNSRGMGYGRIFTSDGHLVSTVMQEGLIRIKR